MTYHLPLTTLSVSMLLGLAAGCAPGRAQHEQPVANPTVTAADIERNGGDPIKTLQSKATGAIVTATNDGGIAIQIRGSSSFYSGNEPLYVIDDVPMTPGPGGALTGVNPHDIESIKVLKNPEDTGIYGVRGANGVIVITTKRPGKGKSD